MSTFFCIDIKDKAIIHYNIMLHYLCVRILEQD
jgi:hypothetical protein